MKHESRGTGTIVRLHARKCIVISDADGQEVSCMLRGKLFEKSSGDTKPAAVGDRVCFEVTSRGAALEKILPRRNALDRPAVGKRGELQTIAANIDRMIIVASMKSPPLRPGLLDRFLVAAALEEIEAVICMNKVDLITPDDEEYAAFEEIRDRYIGLNYKVYVTSALTGEGVDAIREEFRQGISLIMGHSGVGKSTLINRIDPRLNLKIGSISAKHKKGRHTTVSVSLLTLTGGGFVVDTPGIREFGIGHIKPSDLSHYFLEMAELLSECQYHNCTHRHEPGCAVLEALEAGRISKVRYDSYLKMLEDLEQPPAY
ncbi:MAG: ribosome small subunit-dependent GTPase A [Planctomycetota bacterium]|jgi:ribosome biogenesis GTPase